MKTIGVDIDDVTFSLVDNLLHDYNYYYNDNVKAEDIKSWAIHEYLKPECKNIFKFATESMFDNVEFDYITKKALTELNKNFIVYFVTSGHPTTMKWRDKMLQRNLDWYDTSQLVMMRDKGRFVSDYLIDDCYDNVRQGIYTGILINKPWNKKEIYPDWLRANDLFEAVEKIKRNERREND